MDGAIAIVSALKDELNGILNKLKIEATINMKPSTIYRGKFGEREVFVIRTGIGEITTFNSLEYLTGTTRLKAVISTGYAGAAIPDLATGDLVVSTEVLRKADSKDPPIKSDQGLEDLAVQIAGKNNIPFKKGRTITVPALIGNPREKAFLGAGTGCIAIDMESYAAGVAAEKMKIPFIAIRSILDTLNFSYPDTPEPLTPNFKCLLKNPKNFATVAMIANMVTQTRESITRFFKVFIPEL